MEPKYQSVADALRHDIATGLYRDGDTLLTEVELKDKFGVSRQTIRQAISLLENDGLVVRRRGSGTYVTHGAAQAQWGAQRRRHHHLYHGLYFPFHRARHRKRPFQ